MAWTTLTFGYGTQLTSTQMTQLYTNVADTAIRLGGGTAARVTRAGTATVTNVNSGYYTYYAGGNISASSYTAAYTYRFYFTEAQHSNLGYGVIATPIFATVDSEPVTPTHCYVSCRHTDYVDIYCKGEDDDYWEPDTKRCPFSVFVFNTTVAA